MSKIILPRGPRPSKQSPKWGAWVVRVAKDNNVTTDEVEKYVMAKNAGAVDKDAKAFSTEPPVPAKVETDEEILQRIGARFNLMQTVARGACTAAMRAVIVSGPGGLGKTYAIENIVEHYKESKNLKSEIVRGGNVTAVNLYKLLYRNREESNVVVMDDVDSIFSDQDALGVLKAALDTPKIRKLSWLSESNALKADNIPPHFFYEGSMIFITNVDFQKQVDSDKGKLTPHLQALLTRAYYLDLKVHSKRDLQVWISNVITKNHVLVQNGLSHTAEKEILDYMRDNFNKLRNPSIRTALKIAGCYELNPDNWKSMAKEFEIRDDMPTMKLPVTTIHNPA